MPLYEYICGDCRKEFSVHLAYSEYGKADVVCPECGSENALRRIERIRLTRSDRSHLTDMSDRSLLNSVDENPQALAKMMRGMKEQTGTKPDAVFNDVVGRLEKGETPESIDKDYQ